MYFFSHSMSFAATFNIKLKFKGRTPNDQLVISSLLWTYTLAGLPSQPQ